MVFTYFLGFWSTILWLLIYQRNFVCLTENGRRLGTFGTQNAVLKSQLDSEMTYPLIKIQVYRWTCSIALNVAARPSPFEEFRRSSTSRSCPPTRKRYQNGTEIDPVGVAHLHRKELRVESSQHFPFAVDRSAGDIRPAPPLCHMCSSVLFVGGRVSLDRFSVGPTTTFYALAST